MLPITGYLDRLSATPGGRIAVKVSCRGGRDYRADLICIRHADPNPAGPGIKISQVPGANFEGVHRGREQPVQLGSYALVDPGPPVPEDEPITVTALVWPTLPDTSEQVVVASADQSGFVLGIGPEGAWFDLPRRNGGTARLNVGHRLEARRWYRIWACYEPANGRLAVGQALFDPKPGETERWTATLDVRGGALGGLAPAPVIIAAQFEPRPSQHFNGRIEDPAILVLDAGPTVDLSALDARARGHGVVAWWDFSRSIDTQSIIDRGPHGRNGHLVNLPTRGVRGTSWDGSHMSWRNAAAHYAAIHFHEDDRGDCHWQTDFWVKVPDDLAVGVYGVRLTCEGDEDVIPFYVRPRLGQPTAPVLLVIPTFTYLAYLNHVRPDAHAAYRARVAAWKAYPHNPIDHPEYGQSLYNRYRDGSGVHYATRMRPGLTMRPGFMTFTDPRGSGMKHFTADTHIVDWLLARNIAFDVVTDEDVDDEGAALLKPYSAVLTGVHPEYQSLRTLDALTQYSDGGGRLVYLGGNGFYWRIARSPSMPHTIEVRRNEGGIRAWEAETGEYFHSLDGEYGGLWRRNDRPPQKLCGVGFSGQGGFHGSYYRRLPASNDPRAAWIFEGVPDEVLGDFGLSGGGAAGYELDRADVRLGTPKHALILARSEGHPESFMVVPEELLSHVATSSGEPVAKLIRAELVFFETSAGGAVFSVGSITFCGSLSHNDYENNVSRITENVIRRFIDPRPFELPRDIGA